MAKENREHKSSVFADLFYTDEDAKKNLLDLHNALYDTLYTDPQKVRLIGLENVLFQNFKNDVAFSVDDRRIVLSEHQSTVNPNMPLRDLLYIAREYEKLIPVRDRYKSSLVRIANPDFVVFYNGKRNYPVEKTLHLSDAFRKPDAEAPLELKVRVININTAKKHPILEKCRILKEYSLFVETARKYEHTKNQLQKAVQECIKNGILADYLSRKSSEVINMLMAEYSYETDIEVKCEEAAEEAAEKANKKAQKAIRQANKKARKVAEKAREDKRKADKRFTDIIENVASTFRISVKEACEKIGESYENYLSIKKEL